MVLLIATIGLTNFAIGYAVAASLGLGPSRPPRWLCPIRLVPPGPVSIALSSAEPGAQHLLSPLVGPAGH